MGKMVPKGEQANIRHIDSRRRGGRPSGLGYDPATGEEDAGGTYKAEHDIFAVVESKGYNEDRFYTKSVNRAQHGEKLNIRIPQGIDSQMHAAVATVPEYRSIHDLIRDAVVHRLEYIQRRYKISDAARRVLELERIQADAERAAQEIDVMNEAVTNIEERCRKAWESEDWSMLADQMERASETVDWLREPYKTRASTSLREWRDRSRVHIERMRQLTED